MSKGQEAIETIREIGYYLENYDLLEIGYKIDKNCNIIEKELKVLQLLKEAYNQGIFSIGKYFVSYTKKEIEYVICDSEDWNYKRITEEEYNLVKEVLENV